MYNPADAEGGGHGNGVSRRQAWPPRRALHRADEGGATGVWLAGTIPSSTSVVPGCAWTHPPGFSCARDAAYRSCCAGVAIAATATAGWRVGSRPGPRPDAKPLSGINAPWVGAGRTRSARAAGASVSTSVRAWWLHQLA